MHFKFLIIFSIVIVSLLQGYSQESTIISTDNGTLHFKTFGKGAPILIINGGPGLDCLGFENIATQFAVRGYTAILFDQRGTGKSTVTEMTTQTVSLSGIVEDMELIRKHLQIEQWTLFGQSFGGMVAASYAKQYPEKIHSIVFSSSAGLNLDFLEEFEKQLHSQLTQTQIDSLQHLNSALDNGDSTQETLQQYSEILAKAYVYNKDKSAPIAKRLLQVNYTVHTLIMEDLRSQQFDLSTAFTDFEKPVLILQGLHDVISVKTAKKIAKAFPSSLLVLLDKCGHYPWIDVPDQFWSQIEQFLQ